MKRPTLPKHTSLPLTDAPRASSSEGVLPISDTLVAYVISVVILAILALSVPCIELLAKLLHSANHDEEVRAANSKAIANSRKAA